MVHFSAGKVLKRALLFDSWAFEDGRVGRPLLPAIFPSQVPVQDDLLSAEESVRTQADAVRALKVRDGLGNQDPRVVSAVQRLQELKCEAAIIHALLLAYASKDGLEDRVQNPYNILQGLQC
ncbi:hypothetical protein DUNSADRAFT_9276 [Dunaliella salina]|uniref:Encoded protein n=1 Tax=Dunaliella salina TaxID=3046 RepID=A0ABQ7GHT2_DUNSA|nr:hypothetical protein DUNSADRAFT_9276 [Dunaliella salina]|eukprot:KAF5834157.1 hypothetical protein DUNSADRAFT_9276 [Dunaliella salina]